MRVFWAENRICRNERITTTRLVFVVLTCSFFRLSFIYFSRSHSWHCVLTSVCVCVCVYLFAGVYYASTWPEEIWKLLVRQTAIYTFRRLHLMCTRLATTALCIHARRRFSTFPTTHTHTSRVPDVYHHYGLTHKHALYIYQDLMLTIARGAHDNINYDDKSGEILVDAASSI